MADMGTPKPTSLSSISAPMSQAAKAAFFEAFWSRWSAGGFGALSKRETELLLFGCLRRAIDPDGKRSNHDWALLLRITPSRVRSLRLESHLRFGDLFGENGEGDLRRFLAGFAHVQSVDLSGLEKGDGIESVRVSFVVEDPVVQMYLDKVIKEQRSFIDLHRNREVVRVRMVDFFRLVAADDETQIVDEWVSGKASEDGGKLLARVKAARYAKSGEVGKLLAFADDLGKVMNAGPLIDHLKTIVRSQSERRR